MHRGDLEHKLVINKKVMRAKFGSQVYEMVKQSHYLERHPFQPNMMTGNTALLYFGVSQLSSFNNLVKKKY